MARVVLAFTVVMLVLAMACKKTETAVTDTVLDTIAPAAPQPQETGTDAMTQTVELQDGRPEAEGGVLVRGNQPTEAAPTATAPVTGTTATTATVTAPSPSTTTR